MAISPTGAVFCARLWLTLPCGKSAGRVPRRSPGFPASLTQNVAPGCCMLLVRAAAELIDRGKVPDGTWHDWWSYIVVSASGGSVIAGNSPDILYRQHEANAVGEPLGFWRRTVAAVRRGRRHFMILFRRQIDVLAAGSLPLPDHTNAVLAIIERASHGGLLARLRALRIPGIRPSDTSRDGAVPPVVPARLIGDAQPRTPGVRCGHSLSGGGNGGTARRTPWRGRPRQHRTGIRTQRRKSAPLRSTERTRPCHSFSPYSCVGRTRFIRSAALRWTYSSMTTGGSSI